VEACSKRDPVQPQWVAVVCTASRVGRSPLLSDSLDCLTQAPRFLTAVAVSLGPFPFQFLTAGTANLGPFPYGSLLQSRSLPLTAPYCGQPARSHCRSSLRSRPAQTRDALLQSRSAQFLTAGTWALIAVAASPRDSLGVRTKKCG
jgi:hypothetical protein